VLLKMFWPTLHGSAMAIPLQSLEARLGVLRRRRRFSLLKQLLSFAGPALIGATLLLLLALMGAVGRSG
jgi:hypothetical protein